VICDGQSGSVRKLALCELPSVARVVLPAPAGGLNSGLSPSPLLRWMFVTLGRWAPALVLVAMTGGIAT
jgi:hypothetical protein